MKKRKRHVNIVAMVLALILLCADTSWCMHVAAEEASQSGGIAYKVKVVEADEILQSDEVSPAEEELKSALRTIAGNWEPISGRTPAGIRDEIAEWVNEAGEKLVEIVETREVMALVYLSDEYPLRETPDSDGEVLITLLSGQMVNIVDVYLDEAFTVWYQVELNYKGVTICGYIPGEYLAVADNRFLEWEAAYGLDEAEVAVVTQRWNEESAGDGSTEGTTDTEGTDSGSADGTTDTEGTDSGSTEGTTDTEGTDSGSAEGTTDNDSTGNGDTDGTTGNENTGNGDADGSTGSENTGEGTTDGTTDSGNTGDGTTDSGNEGDTAGGSGSGDEEGTNTPAPATPEPVVYKDIEMFPESYQPALLALKEKYPNWVFVKMNTTLDWQTVIDNQMLKGRSLVWHSLPDWTKELRYDSIEDEWYYALYDDTGNWYYASEAGIKMYMDPRNGLTESQIFQFEQLTYNETYHTLDAISAFLNNTFMNDSSLAPETVMTYAEIFWYVGKEERRKVSPFHLAARVLQEQGTGNSPLISGTYPGFEGYYNYFNVNASGTTEADIIRNGLQYAKDNNWKGAYFSIMGGADFVSKNYIQQGQDSLYLQKYNVNPNATYPLYTHQYMQNITAPASEAVSMRRLYASAGALDNTFVFSIPVYENMPEEPCGEPPAVEETPEPTPEPVVPSEQVVSFVERMYTVALGREAEEEGCYYWAAALTTGESDGAGVASGFFLSEELKNKNYSDSEYVNVLYRTFFDRVPVEGEGDFWVNALNAGHPREGVLAGFVNSKEFENLCAAYGISGGVLREDGTAVNPGAAAFTKRLYTKVFERDGDLDGILYWAGNIESGACTAEQAAKSFFESEEYLNKNTTDEEYVRTLYPTFLDREADPAGFENWMNHLANGKTREFVLTGFAQSEEFKELMQRYGL